MVSSNSVRRAPAANSDGMRIPHSRRWMYFLSAAQLTPTGAEERQRAHHSSSPYATESTGGERTSASASSPSPASKRSNILHRNPCLLLNTGGRLREGIESFLPAPFATTPVGFSSRSGSSRPPCGNKSSGQREGMEESEKKDKDENRILSSYRRHPLAKVSHAERLKRWHQLERLAEDKDTTTLMELLSVSITDDDQQQQSQQWLDEWPLLEPRDVTIVPSAAEEGRRRRRDDGTAAEASTSDDDDDGDGGEQEGVGAGAVLVDPDLESDEEEILVGVPITIGAANRRQHQPSTFFTLLARHVDLPEIVTAVGTHLLGRCDCCVEGSANSERDSLLQEMPLRNRVPRERKVATARAASYGIASCVWTLVKACDYCPSAVHRAVLAGHDHTASAMIRQLWQHEEMRLTRRLVDLLAEYKDDRQRNLFHLASSAGAHRTLETIADIFSASLRRDVCRLQQQEEEECVLRSKNETKEKKDCGARGSAAVDQSKETTSEAGAVVRPADPAFTTTRKPMDRTFVVRSILQALCASDATQTTPLHMALAANNALHLGYQKRVISRRPVSASARRATSVRHRQNTNPTVSPTRGRSIARGGGVAAVPRRSPPITDPSSSPAPLLRATQRRPETVGSPSLRATNASFHQQQQGEVSATRRATPDWNQNQSNTISSNTNSGGSPSKQKGFDPRNGSPSSPGTGDEKSSPSWNCEECSLTFLLLFEILIHGASFSHTTRPKYFLLSQDDGSIIKKVAQCLVTALRSKAGQSLSLLHQVVRRVQAPTSTLAVGPAVVMNSDGRVTSRASPRTSTPPNRTNTTPGGAPVSRSSGQQQQAEQECLFLISLLLQPAKLLDLILERTTRSQWHPSTGNATVGDNPAAQPSTSAWAWWWWTRRDSNSRDEGRDATRLAVLAAYLSEDIQKEGVVNKTDSEGHTPLWTASAAGNSDVAQCLLSHGAAPNASNIHGLTPLHIAVRKALLPTVRLLIAGGARVDRHALDIAHSKVMALGPTRSHTRSNSGDSTSTRPAVGVATASRPGISPGPTTSNFSSLFRSSPSSSEGGTPQRVSASGRNRSSTPGSPGEFDAPRPPLADGTTPTTGTSHPRDPRGEEVLLEIFKLLRQHWYPIESAWGATADPSAGDSGENFGGHNTPNLSRSIGADRLEFGDGLTTVGGVTSFLSWSGTERTFHSAGSAGGRAAPRSRGGSGTSWILVLCALLLFLQYMYQNVWASMRWMATLEGTSSSSSSSTGISSSSLEQPGCSIGGSIGWSQNLRY